MKKIIFLTALFIILSSIYSLAAEKPRAGVLRFSNTTNAGWWKVAWVGIYRTC